MVGTFTKFAYSRPSCRSKHQYSLVESVGGKRISLSAALHGVPLLESFEAVEHPAEPAEKDKPVRCPPPENSIVQDGLIWRERVARSFRRQIERVSTWQEGDAVGRSVTISNPGRPEHSNLREKNLFLAHSAPEFAVSRMLDETALTSPMPRAGAGRTAEYCKYRRGVVKNLESRRGNKLNESNPAIVPEAQKFSGRFDACTDAPSTTVQYATHAVLVRKPAS